MSAEIGPITAPQPALPVPAEPERMKAGLRKAVGEDPVAGRAAAINEVAIYLWSAWSEELSAMGVDEPGFSSVLAGAGSEIWLWVMGDRPYDQLAASLAGRILRRLA